METGTSCYYPLPIDRFHPSEWKQASHYAMLFLLTVSTQHSTIIHRNVVGMMFSYLEDKHSEKIYFFQNLQDRGHQDGNRQQHSTVVCSTKKNSRHGIPLLSIQTI